MIKLTHGGKRKGAGRKPARFPAFCKRFRATDNERKDFSGLLTGDAREDFLLILKALKHWDAIKDLPF
jgi:hypothetical protein